MTGHENILVMRRKGYAPAAVWVTDTDSPVCGQIAKDWHQQTNPFTRQFFPQVVIASSDTPEALDFRFLVGLEVHVRSDRSEARQFRLFEAIKKIEPAVIAAVLDGQTTIHRSAKWLK